MQIDDVSIFYERWNCRNHILRTKKCLRTRYNINNSSQWFWKRANALHQSKSHCLHVVALRFIIFVRKSRLSLWITIVCKFSNSRKNSHIATNLLSISIAHSRHEIFNSSSCRSIFSTIRDWCLRQLWFQSNNVILRSSKWNSREFLQWIYRQFTT